MPNLMQCKGNAELQFERLKEAALNKHIKMPNGCHAWDGSLGQDGYGKTKWYGKTVRAHRLVWELVKGPIPPGMFILHKCDNPVCVNIEHLFIGTPADNEADKDAKKRRRNGATGKLLRV